MLQCLKPQSPAEVVDVFAVSGGTLQASPLRGSRQAWPRRRLACQRTVPANGSAVNSVDTPGQRFTIEHTAGVLENWSTGVLDYLVWRGTRRAAQGFVGLRPAEAGLVRVMEYPTPPRRVREASSGKLGYWSNGILEYCSGCLGLAPSRPRWALRLIRIYSETTPTTPTLHDSNTPGVQG
jgi:hypothetical protein